MNYRRLFSFITGLLVCCFMYTPGKEAVAMDAMTLSSLAFKQNGFIPAKYTCDGDDVSPPFTISNVPTEARSLALIIDDPDAPAGAWVHWVIWNIDPATSGFAENSAPRGAVQGMNDFRKRRYGGPCPPSGTHRYFFKLYALDKTLALGPNTTKTALENAMEGHVLSQDELIGLYKSK